MTSDGKLNGLVLIKGKSKTGLKVSYLMYICESKVTYPILVVFDSNGMGISLSEGQYSYGCYFPHWDGYRCNGLCEGMRDVFGKDLSNSLVISEIYYGTLDLQSWEKSLIRFVRSGKRLTGWDSQKEWFD